MWEVDVRALAALNDLEIEDGSTELLLALHMEEQLGLQMVGLVYRILALLT